LIDFAVYFSVIAYFIVTTFENLIAHYFLILCCSPLLAQWTVPFLHDNKEKVFRNRMCKMLAKISPFVTRDDKYRELNPEKGIIRYQTK